MSIINVSKAERYREVAIAMFAVTVTASIVYNHKQIIAIYKTLGNIMDVIDSMMDGDERLINSSEKTMEKLLSLERRDT